MVENGGCGKLCDAGQVLVLQIAGGVQAAAGENGILDAGIQKALEADFQVEIVQFLQQTVLCIIGEITQMVPADLIDGPAGLFHERRANVRFLCRAVLPLQSLHDGGMVIRPHFPQVGCFRSLDRACIGYVKNVCQLRPAAASLMNKCDALGASPYPTLHFIVPQLHTGTGGSIRTLGIDQELVVERVFIEPGGHSQIAFPARRILRDVSGGLVSQIGYPLQSCYHVLPPFVVK
ncbi:MAG: hypothetical protein K2N78_00755 [Oscillospiraceae bacterium]|nr:hypothetical protein [Oscillospiraceae bacterium]